MRPSSCWLSWSVCGEVSALLAAVWQEFMERRVQETDGDRIAIHRLEDRLEVRALHGQQLGECAASACYVPRDDHLAHGRDAFPFEEHVLRAAEADPFCPEGSRDTRVAGCVRVGPHAEAADRVGPFEHAGERLVQRRIGRALRPGHDAHDFTRDGGQRAAVDRAGGAIDSEPVAFLDRRPVDLESAVTLVDVQVLAPDHRALAHAARHDGRVARHAAASRDDGTGGDDAVEVLGRGFVAHQHDCLTACRSLRGDVRIEDGDAARRAWTGRQPATERCRAHTRIDDGVQQLIDLVGRDAAHGFGRVDQPLRDHVACDADGGRCGAFAGPRLQEIESTALDGELEILHVAEMPLESLLRRLELLVRPRESNGHVRDRKRGAKARDDILALGVDEELAVEHTLTRRRIAREGDACPGVVPEVAEYHGNDTDRRAQRVGNAMDAAVIDSLSKRP